MTQVLLLLHAAASSSSRPTQTTRRRAALYTRPLHYHQRRKKDPEQGKSPTGEYCICRLYPAPPRPWSGSTVSQHAPFPSWNRLTLDVQPPIHPSNGRRTQHNGIRPHIDERFEFRHPDVRARTAERGQPRLRASSTSAQRRQTVWPAPRGGTSPTARPGFVDRGRAELVVSGPLVIPVGVQGGGFWRLLWRNQERVRFAGFSAPERGSRGPAAPY